VRLRRERSHCGRATSQATSVRVERHAYYLSFSLGYNKKHIFSTESADSARLPRSFPTAQPSMAIQSHPANLLGCHEGPFCATAGVSADRECIFLQAGHFGIRRHVFARRIEPQRAPPTRGSGSHAGEVEKITVVQESCSGPRVVSLPRMFRLRLRSRDVTDPIPCAAGVRENRLERRALYAPRITRDPSLFISPTQRPTRESRRRDNARCIKRP